MGNSFEKMDMRSHYDLLIEENNDPFRDPPALQKYMESWDGQLFLDLMELDRSKMVLEIGVGTGRLAVKAAGCRIPEHDQRSEEYLLKISNHRKTYALPEEDTLYLNENQLEEIIDKPYYIFENGTKIEVSIDKNKKVYL